MPNIERHDNPLRVFIDSEDGGREVDLSAAPLVAFFSGDLVRYRFTGALPPIENLHLSNFIESLLIGFTADGVDFQECDFKDCVIRDSQFTGCRFDNNSFSTDLIATTTFRNCTFVSSGAHGSEFRDVVFEDCDFTNLLIKSSRFLRCRFVRCKTTNKIMEMSMLDDVRFEGTDIQIDTITSNFGLTQSDLIDCGVRTGRPRNEHRVLEAADVASIDMQRFSDLERLRIEYFLDPDLTSGSEALDSALDVTRWLMIYRNPGSFVDLFQLFSEFVIQMFERDRITLQTVLMLHHVTSTLTADLSDSDNPDLRRVAVSFGGAHLVLSRIVERFLTLLDALTASAAANDNSIALIAEGPLDRAYFRDVLGRWLPRNRVRIVKLVPHNSPLELIAAAITVDALRPLLAMVLSTRISIEIFKIEQTVVETVTVFKTGRTKTTRKTETRLEPKFALQLGRHTTRSGKRSSGGLPLRFSSIIPGPLMLELKINFGTRMAGQLRRIVRGLSLSNS